MQRRSLDRVSISHIASILSGIFLLFVRSDCVFGRRKWKLLQIMASASHPAKQKKKTTSDGFQVNEYNTLSIISIRQTTHCHWMVKLNGFSGYFTANRKTQTQKKPCENWRSTPFRFQMQCISFPSNSFCLCSDCEVHTANGGKRKKWPNADYVCVCIHWDREIITARQRVNNRKLTGDKQWDVE